MAGVPPFPTSGGLKYTPPASAGGTGTTQPAGSSAAPPPMPPASGGADQSSAPPAFPKTGGMPIGLPKEHKTPEPGLLRDIGSGLVKAAQGTRDFGEQVLDFVTSPTEGLDPMNPIAAMIFGHTPKPTHVGEDLANAVPTPKPVLQAEKWANQTHPQTYLGSAAQGAGELLPFALMPAGGEGLVGRGLAQGKQLLGTTAIGGLSGVGSKAGSDVGQTIGGKEGAQTGAVVGSLLGAGLPVAGMYGLSKLGSAAGDVVPVTKNAQRRVARSILTRAEPETDAARQRIMDKLAPSSAPTSALDERGPNGEILPGSPQTTATMAGSPGLARLHEVLKASGQGDALKETEEAQAAARANAVSNIGPAEKIPPAMLKEEVQKELKRRDLQGFAAQNKAEKGLEKATAAQPGLTTTETPYQVGANLQASIASGEDVRKQVTHALFGRLDEKNPTIDMSGLGDSVKEIKDEGARSKAEFPPQLDRLLDRASDLGDSPDTTWAQVQELRAAVNQSIEQSKVEYGQNSPLTRRLTQLKSGIDGALSDSVSKLVDNEDEALNEEGHGGQPAAGPAGGNGPPEGAAIPDGGVAPEGAGLRDTSGGLPAGVSDQVAPEEGAVGDGETSGPLGPGDAQLYRRALALHAETKQLYQNPVIGPIIAKSRGQLALAPEKVIDRLVAAGAKGGEVARAVKALAKDNPNLLSQYDTAIGLSIRKAAMTPDGLNPAKFASWVKNHQEMTRIFPTLGKRLSTIQDAQQMVEEAVEKRKLLKEAYDLKAFKSVTAGEDPAVAMTHLLNGTPAEARQFMKRISQLKAAPGAARTAMADHLAGMLLQPMAGDQTGSETVQLSALKSLMRNNAKRQVIREVLGPQAVKTLDRVITDAAASNTKALSGIGVGQSGTTPLREGVKGLKGPHTMLGYILQQVVTPVGAAVTGGFGNPLAAFTAETAAGGVRYVQAAQQAKAIGLLARAMVDPKVYLELTKPIPADKTAFAHFLKRMRYTVASSYIQGSPHDDAQGHAHQ